jgi:uncharacterized protein YkwD
MTRIALTLAAAALAAALAAAPAAMAGPGLNRFEREVIRGLNDARAQHGLAAVRSYRPLNRAADRHSHDMLRSDFFDHPSSDGTPFDRRVRRFFDATMVGETLAALPQRRGGAGAVVQMWLDSAVHRAILLEPGFRRIGVARRWGTLGADRNAVVTADFASGD